MQLAAKMVCEVAGAMTSAAIKAIDSLEESSTARHAATTEKMEVRQGVYVRGDGICPVRM